jgi:hypothetical protein
MSQSPTIFADGFGRRVLRVASADAQPIEHLILNPVLAAHDGFMSALRERVTQLQARRLTSYARTLALDLEAPGGPELVTEYIRGWRLADLLDVAESENLTLDIGVVMLLLRQLLPTAAMLSTTGRDAASGALGPEHLLLTPQGRLVLTDSVFGPAIEALQWSGDQLWRTLRVATAPGRAVSQRGDVVQAGLTVLSLLVGRRLRDDEFPDRLEALVSSARQKAPSVIDAPLAPGLRDWLMRALQLGPKPFDKLFDAQMALERVLTGDAALLAQPAELEQAVARFDRFMPPVELPEPPVELPLLEAPPPDLVPLAVAFDRAPVRQEPAVSAPPPVEVPAADAEPTGTEHAPAVEEAPVAPTRKSGVRKGRKAAAAIETAPAPVAQAPTHVREPEPGPESAPEPEAAPELEFTAALDPVYPSPVRRSASVTPPPPEPEPVGPFTPSVRVQTAPEPAAPEPYAVTVPEAPPMWRSPQAVAALLAVALLQSGFIARRATRPSENLGGDGELVVQSRPEGAAVSIDDTDRGVTPLTIRLSPGAHVLQVKAGSAEPRVIPLAIRAGTQTAQYVEMQGVATTGVLEVRSEPSKARVTIDGRERGSTPLTLRDVAPGDYQVVLERAGWKSTQTVRIEPGATAQLVVPIPRGGAAPPATAPPPDAAAPPAAEPPKIQ